MLGIWTRSSCSCSLVVLQHRGVTLMQPMSTARWSARSVFTSTRQLHFHILNFPQHLAPLSVVLQYNQQSRSAKKPATKKIVFPNASFCFLERRRGDPSKVKNFTDNLAGTWLRVQRINVTPSCVCVWNFFCLSFLLTQFGVFLFGALAVS